MIKNCKIKDVFIWFFISTSVCFGEPVVTVCSFRDSQFGGQLFTVAMAYGIAKKNQIQLVIPQQAFLSALGGEINYGILFRNALAQIIIEESAPTHFDCCSANDPLAREVTCITHTVHHFSYFDEYRHEIRELFSPFSIVRELVEHKYPILLNHPNTVAVHLRTYHPAHETHLFLGLEYFKKAMMMFPSDSLYVIFSDRIDYCKLIFSDFDRPLLFVEGNDHVTDLFLMAMCNNIIIANSTYSWWAAYLRRFLSGRVIAPSKWLTTESQDARIDSYPAEWEVLNIENLPSVPQEMWDYPTTSIQESSVKRPDVSNPKQKKSKGRR